MQPNDMDTFQQLLKKHVENVESQLLDSGSHYQRTVSSQGKPIQDFSGITRIIMTSLSTSVTALRLSEIVSLYKLIFFLSAFVHGLMAQVPLLGSRGPSGFEERKSG